MTNLEKEIIAARFLAAYGVTGLPAGTYAIRLLEGTACPIAALLVEENRHRPSEWTTADTPYEIATEILGLPRALVEGIWIGFDGAGDKCSPRYIAQESEFFDGVEVGRIVRAAMLETA